MAILQIVGISPRLLMLGFMIPTATDSIYVDQEKNCCLNLLNPYK